MWKTGKLPFDFISTKSIRKVYQPHDGVYRQFDKYQGRKVTVENILDSIMEFFFDGEKYKVDVVIEFLERMELLIDELQELEHVYRIYSGSLILVYEGDLSSSDTESKPRVELKMVDFAHTFPYEDGQVQDDGYLFGLTNLKSVLEQIVDRLSIKTNTTSPSENFPEKDKQNPVV